MLKPITQQDKLIHMLIRSQTGFNCDADLRATDADHIMPLTIEECVMNYNMEEWEV